MTDQVHDVWLFEKRKGNLQIQIVKVTEHLVQYRTVWCPDSVANPRLCDPVSIVEWRRWRKRGTLISRNGDPCDVSFLG